jgi:hypothetical protein
MILFLLTKSPKFHDLLYISYLLLSLQVMVKTKSIMLGF